MITELKDNEIFVFGSNLAGRHGKGAAKQAMKWGAIYGIGWGLQGQTYAIPTKDRQLKVIPLSSIYGYIKFFISYAFIHNKYTYKVTEIGCGLAGYTSEEIAPAFKRALNVKNIELPESFIKVLNNIN